MSDRDQLVALLVAAAPSGAGSAGGMWAALADAVIAAGWRPPPTGLASVEQLDGLADHTVITDREGSIWGVNERREWCELATAGLDADEIVHWGPFTVVAEPADTPKPP